MSRDKDLLAQIIRRRMTTVFIGAIADIQKTFGELWTSKPGEELSDEDKEDMEQWRLVFEEIRKSILDRGNDQGRAMIEDLDKFGIEWCGAKMFDNRIRKPGKGV